MLGNYNKHPLFRAFTTAKKYPLSRENGNKHAAPSCIRVGGGGREHCQHGVLIKRLMIFTTVYLLFSFFILCKVIFSRRWIQIGHTEMRRWQHDMFIKLRWIFPMEADLLTSFNVNFRYCHLQFAFRLYTDPKLDNTTRSWIFTREGDMFSVHPFHVTLRLN